MKLRQKGGDLLRGWKKARGLLGLDVLAGVFVGVLVAGMLGCDPSPPPPAEPEPYGSLAEASADGSGRVYMGREIARGLAEDHALDWLERPTRDTAERPDRVVQALDLRPSDHVADIGAGLGFFTFRLAAHVPAGKVFAVDIDAALLDTIRTRATDRRLTNITPILGTETQPNLPIGEVDVALIVASYHEFSHPYEMVEGIVQALRPGGRLVLVEFRGEDATIPVPRLHRMTEAQVRAEMEAVGLLWRETRDILPQQHFMVFEKPMP